MRDDVTESSVPERSTLRDVAALAGVSAKTASRTLNGHLGVSAETRDRVEQAAIKLRFRPNRLAKELRTGGGSNVVGLVVADISNPTFALVAAAAEAAMLPRGLELIVGSTGEDAQRERQLVHSLLERRVQALLVVSASEDHRYLQFEASMGTPIVFIGRPPIGLSVDAVIGDEFAAAQKATEALIAAGHDRIAVIAASPDAWTVRQRVAGARAALSAHGKDPDGPLVYDGARTPVLAAEHMRHLLAQPDPPTAVFALNNLSMLGAVRALRDTGEQLTVLSIDDSDVAELLDVSVVATQPELRGERAALRALTRIDGNTDSPVTEVMEMPMIIRTPLDQPLLFARTH